MFDSRQLHYAIFVRLSFLSFFLVILRSYENKAVLLLFFCYFLTVHERIIIQQASISVKVLPSLVPAQGPPRRRQAPSDFPHESPPQTGRRFMNSEKYQAFASHWGRGSFIYILIKPPPFPGPRLPTSVESMDCTLKKGRDTRGF